MKKTICFIFARGGSKGIPHKNIKNLGGRPLISYAINIALSCPFIHRTIVSTDDPTIASISKNYGAEVLFLRPKELALDTSPEIDAWKHAVEYYQNQETDNNIDIFISLPPTAPLRTSSDVEKCFSEFIKNQVDLVISVKKSSRSPFFNMITKDLNGLAHIISSSDLPIHRRQDAPVTYDITTVAYVTNPDYIFSCASLMEGRVLPVELPEEHSLDIDTDYDWFIAESYINSPVFGGIL